MMIAEDISRAIDRGVTFLRSAQLPSGEFKTFLGSDMQLSNAVFDSSPFVTSFVLYTLSHVDGSQVDDIVRKGTAFLRSEMEFGGVWRYYGSGQFKHCRIPPDLDDTACACFALRIHGGRVPSNRWLFRYNRDKAGRYLTWVLTKDETFAPRFRLARMIGNLQAKRARRTAPVPTVVSDPRLLGTPIDIVPADDVDPAVNANVILFLGENAETAPAIEYLIDLMRTGVKEGFSHYYKDVMALHYMIARAYLHSAPSLAVVGNRVVGDILARQQANGSFGHALAAALAASALLTFAPLTAAFADIIEFLLSTQRDDGSWPAHPFYSGPTEFWGSEELTTGLCIEALARYRKVQKVSMAVR